MPHIRVYSLIAVALAFAAVPLHAQLYTPQSIHFEGASAFTDAELSRAAGVEQGHGYSSDELNEHAQQLMATGIFTKVGYKFDGAKLEYTVDLSPDIYPILIGNLPVETGAALDEKLHDRVPLYHGKVPPEGSMLADVCKAFEEMLADNGVHAKVVATAFGKDASHPATAIRFSIDSPQVRIGPVRFDGVSYGFKEQVAQVAAGLSAPYDAEKSTGDLERRVGAVYASHGFAAAEIHATTYGRPVMADGVVRVPYMVTVKEGHAYKPGKVELSPKLPLDRAEIDSLVGAQGGFSLDTTHVEDLAMQVEQRLRAHGYLDCRITPHAEIDEDAGVVNYTVEGDPGPIYHLGVLKFDGASDELRGLLLKSWKMQPGDPFNAGYVNSFMLEAQRGEPDLRQALAGLRASYDVNPDPASHDVSLVIRLEKQ